MQFCFTVDDVCLEGYSTEEHRARLLDFLSKERVQATFFVVPLTQGVPLTRKPDYIRILNSDFRRGQSCIIED